MKVPLLTNDPTGDLSQQVVLVTGAANGIGAETARQLIDKGARVALLDCDEAALATIVDELGEQAAGFVADVSDAGSIQAAVKAAAARFGGIDVVLANAGISGPVTTVDSIDPVAFERVIEINLLGVFRTVRAALPYVSERAGYVMLTSSIMAAVPGPTVAAYCASKAGVEAFGRALRIELAESGVAVGIAYFGLIDTEMVRGPATSTGGISELLKALPSWLSKPAPVSSAGAVVVSGIERRASRVYAPRYVPMLLESRTLLAKADQMFGRSSAITNLIHDARQRAHEAEAFTRDEAEVVQ